ncbi:MAG: hypothetical protein JSS09_05060 [Verrucomicrobia bacterium]|nr:hypothetical protein [Verrucomicrobiota bacterium]
MSIHELVETAQKFVGKKWNADVDQAIKPITDRGIKLRIFEEGQMYVSFIELNILHIYIKPDKTIMSIRYLPPHLLTTSK